MILAGVDIFRLNLSHIDVLHGYSFLANIIRHARDMAQEVGRPVEIMIDHPGHKFRLGEFVEREVEEGDPFFLTCATLNDGEIPCPHENYLLALENDQEILIGDGVPRLKVVKPATASCPTVLCEVTLAGLLEPNKGVTARGLSISSLNLPAMTDADEQGQQFGVDVGAEHVVMSYGTTARQMGVFVKRYRQLGGLGRTWFKYELEEAGRDLAGIVTVSDGGFVGRGDLSLSIPSQELPAETVTVIKAFGLANKPCIVGTQILSSMKTHPFPTHGERDGVYRNVEKGAWGLMVSDETSNGKYPVEVIQALNRLIIAAESHCDPS